MLQRTARLAYAAAMRHPTELHSGGVDWPKIRILLYSMDDGFRFLTRQTFRKLNVREVLSTSVSADATPMMNQAPDIALVDVDGDAELAMAFLRRVREADPRIPVLMVAKSSDRTLIADAVPLGIEGFVPKPVSGHELSLRVGNAVREPQRVPVPKPAVAPAVPVTRPRNAVAAGGTAARPLSPGGGTGSYGAAGGGRGSIGGGTYGGGDDQPAAGGRPGGGKLELDDLPPAAANSKGGSYGDLADQAAPPAAGKLDALAEALPATLRPKRRRREEQAQAEAERATWQAELAEAGHTQRQGDDVAALNVEAIVAAHLAWLTSRGSDGKRAHFTKMDLAGGDFAGTVLANADFRDADLSDARLADARLDGADFRYAVLGAADLSGANLGVAQLRHSDLRLANLQGACLRGADLSGARLCGAKLAGADFKGATLVGSDLGGADLSQADNLTQAQIDKAACDMKTKLPPGVSRPRREE
jgi:uncharacterized protein YjbI with pentapeptide repeats